MRPTVSGVLVTCRVTKSATSTRRSSVISSMPSSWARSADTNGSWATSFMPNAWARWATSLPMRPRPTTPSVLSASSTPSHFDRSHRPSTRAAWACGMLRAWASSIAIVCSAVERMFDCGALTTITPRSVAASTSTLSRPMPARPTTTRSVPASSTSAVTWVAERMISAAAPGTTLDQLVGRQARAGRRRRGRRRGAAAARRRRSSRSRGCAPSPAVWPGPGKACQTG